MNLSKAIQMYKLDYRIYPETLGGYVQADAKGIIPIGPTTHSTSCVRGEYIKSAECFHCPYSPIEDTSAVTEVTCGGKVRRYYAYDSYDVYTPVESAGVTSLGREALRYTRIWAEKPADVATYDPGLRKTREREKLDCTRQLRWKKPPDDTVVTWCSYHRGDANSVVVLLLSGTMRAIPAEQVEGADGKSGSRWRTVPTRSYY